jgi:flagellar motility protein MotE (MotC chaperone)
MPMMNKLKTIWLSAGLPLQIAVISFALIVVVYFIFAVSSFIHNKRYEAKISRIEKAANEAEAKANAKLDEADKINAENIKLKSELAKVNQDLAALESSRVAQVKAVNVTRKVYVQSKSNSQPSIPLSGDNDLDRKNLCASLASVGIKCE